MKTLILHTICLSLILVVTLACKGKAFAMAADSTILITGQVTDSLQQQPIAYATIIFSKDNTVLQTNVADSLGRFSLQAAPGSYTIKASYLGYISRPAPLEVTGNTAPALQIQLALPGKYLQAVTVTGRKPVLEVQPDRIIYHISDDPYAKNKSLSEAIKKAPLVTVDQSGGISLRGNSKVTVQINGKPVSDYAIPASQALKMIPASNVDHIEVLTTPTVASDADAANGIINIVTKSDLPLRTNILAGTETTIGKNYVINPSVGLLYGARRFNVAINGSYTYFVTPGSTLTEQTAAQYYQLQEGSLKYKGQPYNINAAIQFEPDKNNSLRAGIVLNRNNYTFRQQLNSRLQDATGADEFYRDADNTYRENSQSLTLDYKHRLHKPGQELTLSALYNLNEKNNRLQATNSFTRWETTNRTLEENGSNHNPNRTLLLQSDYKMPVGKHRLTAGVKFTYRNFRSDFNNLLTEETVGKGVFNTTTVNSYQYKQDITAGYAQFRLNLPKQYILIGGIRYETTGNNADFGSTQTKVNNRYNNFIPAVTAARIFGRNTVTLSYSRAINRPGIGYLNPYMNYIGYNTYQQGNPDLHPEKSHKLLLTYNYNGDAIYLYADVSADFWKDYILPVSREMDSSAILTTYKNVGTYREWGPSLSISWTLSKAFALNVNAAARQVFTRDTLLQSDFNNKLSANASAVLSYYPAPGWEVTAEYNYYTPVYRFQTRIFTGSTSAISVARSLFKGRGRLSVGMLNPLSSEVKYERLNINSSLTSYTRQLLSSRAVTIGFHITLGNENVKKKGNTNITDTGIKESNASPIVN